ncbi:restriction endonuclease [Roseateles chitinivorans]|uniref:restriction endonuclease n=1 Tax=Roseateles chitinivorans TaxID=2917965 RepID=UPI003D67BD25
MAREKKGSSGEGSVNPVAWPGAVVSFLRQLAGRTRREQSARGEAAAAIEGMTWHQFELQLGEAFRQKGFTVVEIGGGGPDGGVDLVLRKPARTGNETFLVQCRHWKAHKVGVSAARDLYGVMAARSAAGGVRGDVGSVHQGSDLVRGGPQHAAHRRAEAGGAAGRLGRAAARLAARVAAGAGGCHDGGLPGVFAADGAAHAQARADGGSAALCVLDVSGVQGNEAGLTPDA